MKGERQSEGHLLVGHAAWIVLDVGDTSLMETDINPQHSGVVLPLDLIAVDKTIQIQKSNSSTVVSTSIDFVFTLSLPCLGRKMSKGSLFCLENSQRQF